MLTRVSLDFRKLAAAIAAVAVVVAGFLAAGRAQPGGFAADGDARWVASTAAMPVARLPEVQVVAERIPI